MRNLTRPRYPAPIVQQAERADIPDFARITMAAETPSLLTFLCYPSRESKLKVARDMIKTLEEVFDMPELIFMKAIDADTKVITGIAVWQRKGYKRKELGASSAESEDAMEGEATTDAMFAARLLRARNANDQEEPGAALMKYIVSEHSAFLDSWTKGTKHIYLAILMTDPRFQRRGIGTAMLDWGHKRADKDGVPCFLIASPAGHPLYQSVGWKNVEKPLQLELKDWVKYAENGDMGWGMYKYYYMLRMPNTATSKED